MAVSFASAARYGDKVSKGSQGSTLRATSQRSNLKARSQNRVLEFKMPAQYEDEWNGEVQNSGKDDKNVNQKILEISRQTLDQSRPNSPGYRRRPVTTVQKEDQSYYGEDDAGQSNFGYSEGYGMDQRVLPRRMFTNRRKLGFNSRTMSFVRRLYSQRGKNSQTQGPNGDYRPNLSDRIDNDKIESDGNVGEMGQGNEVRRGQNSYGMTYNRETTGQPEIMYGSNEKNGANLFGNFRMQELLVQNNPEGRNFGRVTPIDGGGLGKRVKNGDGYGNGGTGLDHQNGPEIGSSGDNFGPENPEDGYGTSEGGQGSVPNALNQDYFITYGISLPDDGRGIAQWDVSIDPRSTNFGLMQIHPYGGTSNVDYSMENNH